MAAALPATAVPTSTTDPEFHLSAADFARIRELIYARAGISLHEGKQAMVYSRLSRRLRETRHPSFSAYLEALERPSGPSPDAEWQEFINCLTTNLTSFFREEHHFHALREDLLARRGRPLRIWCAASSTGEEPYSIAMTVHEAIEGAAVDYRSLRLDAQQRTATKAQAALQADLGGIAKGYGVDLAARAIEALGLEDYMIEVGGEVRTRGRNAAGQPWQIGIEEPDAVPQRARKVVPLAGLAMATSGDYRIYFEQAGRRYSHEIDPRSAAPIAHGLASVTVVADDCMAADALATALIVLGPQAGWALAQRERLAAYFIVRDADGRLHDRATEAFAVLIGTG